MKKFVTIGLLVIGALAASAQFVTTALYHKKDEAYINTLPNKPNTITDNTIAISGAIWFSPGQTIVYNGDSTVRLQIRKNGVLVYDSMEVITHLDKDRFDYSDGTKPWVIDQLKMNKSLSGLATGIPYLIYKDMSSLRLTSTDIINITLRSGVYPSTWLATVTTGINDVEDSNAPVLISSTLMWGTSNVYLESYSDGSRAKVVRLQ